jgi:hypothetical protein
VRKFLELMRTRVRKANEQDKKLERPIERVSRLIWPWPESKLILLVSSLAVLDYISTFTALKFNISHRVYEAGSLAKWALTAGGFPMLLLVDGSAIGALILIALGVRALYTRFGFPGFARSAFVFFFVPYAIIILPVIINNFFNTFR